MDKLVALKVFRSVVEQGSFAKGARRVGLSPAAISKNIAELEAQLNVRLLNRTTRRMSLTEAGQIYYDQVARVLDDLQAADRSLGPLSERPSGLLRVSAPLTFTVTQLSARIIRFLETYPDLTLDLQLDDRRVDLITEGFDVAIRGIVRLEDSSLIVRKLTTLDMVVCASPDYLLRNGAPDNPMDLRQHNCIQFTLASHADEWTFTRGPQVLRVPISGRYKVTSSFAIHDALLHGFGIGMIPRQYIEADIRSGRLVTVLNDWKPTDTTVYITYPSRQHVLPKVRAFVDFLADSE